jgi:hypothetical protein
VVVAVAERAGLGNLDDQQHKTFRFRVSSFVADSESRETVHLQFDKDPDQGTYQLQNEQGGFPKTDLNGLVEGVLTLSDTQAQRVLNAQGSTDGWLTYHAVSKGHTGAGRVRLLASTGLSVISDIDDTIKVTEIPAGEKIVLRNTFFREFVAAPGMVLMYQGFGKDASFHYVSGGPWQLYDPLAAFLFGPDGGFPHGTVHMKNVRTNPLAPDTWKDLWRLVANGSEQATFDDKVRQISEIIERFRDRKFILIGDSGERDPEVYCTIQARFPTQVQEIRIRDVVGVKEDLVKGMTIIPASLIRPGVSQFGQ